MPFLSHGKDTLGDSSHGPLVSARGLQQALPTFCSGLRVQGCLCSEQSWKMEMVLPVEPKVGMLTVHTKIAQVPKL